VSDIFNKTFVAKQSGLRSIIIPHQNKKDIVDIINKYPTMFHDNFKYHLASTLHDVVQLMFET
jgi:ATP-dependent Lon protease